MATLATDSPVAPEAAPAAMRRGALPALALAILLVALLVAHLPAFLCMPFDTDVCLWDLFARRVLDGGVPYRDLMENNFPGMLWAHLAVRCLFGWRPEVLRAADAAVVGAIVFLLVRWLPPRASLAWRFFAAFVMASFYLTTSEWCHCQRDTWMLLPALLALNLRYRQLAELAGPGPRIAAIGGRGLLEGFLWASACWVKPYAAVPCLVCWLTGAWHLRATASARGRLLALDGFSVFAGGLVAGAAGCSWLLASGGWASFWDVMLVWNREYVRFDMSEGAGWVFRLGPAVRLAPWPLIHLAAVPMAVVVLWRRESSGRQLLAALYVGWLVQSVLLQHGYDYVHVPALLLGIAVLCQGVVDAPPGLVRSLSIAAMLLGVGIRLPAVTASRLACWGECFREGSSVELRDRLSLLPRVNWAGLEQVRVFLAAQDARDGEVTCLTRRTIPLYEQLGFHPSTPYPFLESVLVVFASHREQVYASLAAGRQRFVVCDLTTTRWRHAANSAPDSFPRDGLLFRAGRYAVYSVAAADMPGWVRANLDL
jgi:hypothetical protein